MADFETLRQERPALVILDNIDPHCAVLRDFLVDYELPESSFFYVDTEEGGEEVKKDSIAYVEESRPLGSDTSLPHLYCGGDFFLGGQSFNRAGLRNKLISVGAIKLRKGKETEALYKSKPIVCFLNKYSAYSGNMQTILRKYVKDHEEDKIKYVYVDEDKDMEIAALYFASFDLLPVVFIGNFGKSLETLSNSDNNYDLYNELGELGVIPPPAHDELKALKEEYKVLLIGVTWSSITSGIESILQSLTLPAGALYLSLGDDWDDMTLLNAARVDASRETQPFFYVNGSLVPESEYVSSDQEASIKKLLKNHGII